MARKVSWSRIKTIKRDKKQKVKVTKDGKQYKGSKRNTNKISEKDPRTYTRI